MNIGGRATQIRWGVIGLGFFGEYHAEALSQLSAVKLVAACTRRPVRLEEVADRYSIPRRYTDYRQLLADPEVDAVSIVTHVDDHLLIALDALANGKHVLLEKPMAPTAAECDRIVDAARRSRGLFMVGHICRFDPRVVLAKQAIDEGRIGRIISMHARRNLSKVIGLQVCKSISALMGDGVHDADLMLWFTGARPVSVFAQEVRPGASKHAEGGWAMFRLDSGAVGVVESVWYLPQTTPFQVDARMEIIGSEGALYVDCSHPGLEIHDGRGIQLPDTHYWPRLQGRRGGALAAELSYFAECILNDHPPERITPQESRNAVALMEAAEQSSRAGQAIAL